MSSVLLSIIVPVYNVEKYLEECIESINKQDLDQCEIILIDDGSTDGSGELCDEICDRSDYYKVIHKENGGLSDARNVGIEKAKGEYILFLDSDDKLSENCLSVILGTIRNSNDDIILGRAMTFSEGTSHIAYNIDSYQPYSIIEKPSKILLSLDKNSHFWFAAWLIIIKREFIVNKALYFKEGIYHEDELWVPMVFVNARSARLMDTCFYMYRVNREGSIVSSPKIKREFDKIKIAQIFNEYECKDKDGKHLLKRRSAALIYGIVLSLFKYRDDYEYETLLLDLKANIKLMRFGKYLPVWLLCDLIGVEMTSKILNNKASNCK